MADTLEKIGEVFTFFAKPMVAGIKITAGSLSVGDTILIKGMTTNIEMTVDSMQIDRKPVQSVDAGAEVGIKVPDKVRPTDSVYRKGTR